MNDSYPLTTDYLTTFSRKRNRFASGIHPRQIKEIEAKDTESADKDTVIEEE